MRPVEFIAEKRSGGQHSPQAIADFIAGVSGGQVPDEQVAAWLMAVCWRGLTSEETAALTEAMAGSGQRLDLQQRWPASVDKHSTGGVGDKTTLVLAPMLAAAGHPVGKMSGRGLGFSGGTIDKLEAIPGLRCELTRDDFLRQLDQVGLVVAAQSPDLAPADGRLYALRGLTATVDSIPLIASSVMSKKLACRAGRLVLDVKVGRGAFMKTENEARQLAEAMVAIGQAGGLPTTAVLSDMDQPEGNAIGNALEVREAIAALSGDGPRDVLELCLALAGAAGVEGLEATIADESALAKLGEMIAAQGGDWRVVNEPDRLPQATLRRFVAAPAGGYVAAIDAEALGWAAVRLGAGRARKGEAIDPAVGLVLLAKLGDAVEAGQPLLEVHANDRARLEQALAETPRAFTLSAEPVAAAPQVKAIIPPS